MIVFLIKSRVAINPLSAKFFKVHLEMEWMDS